MQVIYTENVIYRLYNGTCYMQVIYTEHDCEQVCYLVRTFAAPCIWTQWSNLLAGLLPCANLCCTLYLNTVKQSFQKDGPPLDDIPSNKFWKQKDQQFRRCNRNSHISIKSALRVTLTLNIAAHFCVWHPNLRRCITMQGLVTKGSTVQKLSLIHIWRCRRAAACRSRWSPYH